MEALIAAGTALIWVIAGIIIVTVAATVIGGIFVGSKMRSMMREMRGDRGRFGRQSRWASPT